MNAYEMDKFSAIRQLRDLGAAIPPTLLSNVLDARVQDFIKPLTCELFYVRWGATDGEQSALLSRKQLELSTFGLVNFSERLVIQPMINFDFGGAILCAGEAGIYCEMVQGLPVGLLRHGELAYACRSTKSGDNFLPGRQERSWSIIDLKVTSYDIDSTSSAVQFESILTEAATQVPFTSYPALFEWGMSGGHVIWLDVHDVTYSLNRLLQIVDSATEPQLLRSSTVMPLPSLASDAAGMTEKVFERGARLSHVVTYSARIPHTSIMFLS